MATKKTNTNSLTGAAAIADHIVAQTAKRAAAKKAPAVKKTPAAKPAVKNARTAASFEREAAAPVSKTKKEPKIPNSGISGQHFPAEKVTAKKPVAAKRRRSASSSATQQSNNSTPSGTSSKIAKVDSSITAAPDQGAVNPEAIAAAITLAATQSTSDIKKHPSELTRADISSVMLDEVSDAGERRLTKIETMNLTAVIGDAVQRTIDTLEEFHPAHRSGLRPFVQFFERFWGAIENRQVIAVPFLKDQFAQFMHDQIPLKLAHGEYARYTFSCGSRVVILNTFAGSVAMAVAKHEYVAALKALPSADPAIIEEQEKKHPSDFHFLPYVTNALSALVRCDFDQPGLSLMVLNRVFGDPIDFMMSQIEHNLTAAVEDTLDYLIDTEARAVYRPKAA
jgi:hypothetical protein